MSYRVQVLMASHVDPFIFIVRTGDGVTREYTFRRDTDPTTMKLLYNAAKHRRMVEVDGTDLQASSRIGVRPAGAPAAGVSG
jgi:hypothetical protein